MAYLLILVFIPVFFVGIVIYLSTIYHYAFNGNLDLVLLLIGLFSSIISSFVVLKTFAIMESKKVAVIKIQKRVDAIINLFSFTLLLLFGVSLIISSTNNMNVGKIIVGIGIVLFYIYVFYYSLFSRKKVTFNLVDIIKINDKTYLYSFDNKEYGIKEIYLKEKDKYKKGENYMCSYSPMFNDITSVIKRVDK